MGVPSPRAFRESEAMPASRDARKRIILVIWVRIALTAAGSRAAAASAAEGPEMLYGALVFERTWISGGWAIAMPILGTSCQ